MTTRDDLITALDGGTPERTPLSVLDWFFSHPKYDVDEWRPLFDQGLGLLLQCQTVELVEHGVVHTVEYKVAGDRRYRVWRKETPVGTLQSVTVNSIRAPRLADWHCEYWIKEPQDYEVQRWIVEHTEVVPRYDEFARMEGRAGDRGVTVVAGGRTPAMTIQIDYAGGERFALDVALGVEELFELYEAQTRLFMEANRAIAAGPGRYVSWFEQLTASMLGPRRYAALLMPVYNEAVPVLEAAGKRAMVQYNGKLRAIADQIAVAPFHVVELLTEPPEGDMMLDECRAAWPDKAFRANVNVGLFSLPPDELREAVIARRERAGKQGLAFEFAEDIPANWREVVPVVLRALQELG